MRLEEGRTGDKGVTGDRRVDAMIIGAMKCGTTTLADQLKAHPEVAFCRRKEPEFFSKNTDWRKGLDGYHALFDGVPGRVRMEASTGLTFYPFFNRGIWKDLYEYNPDLRFIYLVRDPIDRVISHYMHIRERGFTDLPIDEALRTIGLMLNVTRYHAQVSPYIETFGRDQVLILLFEDLVKDRERTLGKVASHLGIDPTLFPPQQRHSNRSVGGRKHLHRFDAPPFWAKAIMKLAPARFKDLIWQRIAYDPSRSFSSRPELASEWREAVVRMLRSDIEALERLLDRDLSAWYAADRWMG